MLVLYYYRFTLDDEIKQTAALDSKAGKKLLARNEETSGMVQAH